MNVPHCLPDHITPKQFLTEYWQKKPLLIKKGLPQIIGMFEPDDILGLSLDPEASARLITQTPKDNIANPTTESHYNWVLEKGPLDESQFENLPEKWTALVQNLEQWSPELANLWKAFDFIPQWQRDDIMVSVAPFGGSVGKHYDDYDVFLAQGYGNRHWQLGKYCDESTEFVADVPIRIFDDMGDIIFDEILEPGDVLYVPPKLSHYGVATNECMTFSFGFRRPNLMQVLDGATDIATSEPSLFVPMMLNQDVQSSGLLDNTSIQQMKEQLIIMLNSPTGDSIIQQAVSEAVSKREYDILVPEELPSIEEVLKQINAGAVINVDYNSRIIYTKFNEDHHIYINGQIITNITPLETQLLVKLADGQSLIHHDLSDLIKSKPNAIIEWLENSWVWLDI